MPLPLYKILSRLMVPPKPPTPFPDFPIFPPTNPFKISAEADVIFRAWQIPRLTDFERRSTPHILEDLNIQKQNNKIGPR